MEIFISTAGALFMCAVIIKGLMKMGVIQANVDFKWDRYLLIILVILVLLRLANFQKEYVGLILAIVMCLYATLILIQLALSFLNKA